MKKDLVKIVKKIEDDYVDLDPQIEEIKAFFSDPKTRPEADKLRHSIKYILAEIATEEEELRKADDEEINKNRPQTFMEFIFGKPEAK